ncbi:hypothetical protein TWF694_001982 [Orbilia ellipsospora]|uniref:Zn(2)-C6 fungal-type domain-containing protein n=1 Tax=Orbilia ellipsospora TaxID=2528407 RepID=A0AAV9X479_9PEZI
MKRHFAPLAPATEAHRLKRSRWAVQRVPNAPRRGVAKACDICKKRKIKCGGETPACTRCQRLEKECVYTLNAAEYRSHLRQKIALQTAENEKYQGILDHIRQATSPALQKTMNLLKTNISLEDVLLFVRNDGSSVLSTRDISPEPATTDLTLLANTYLEETDQTVPKQIELGVMDDRPLYDLKSAPWTAATDDDELVSHLFSSFITWDAIALNFFDIDIFLEAMQGEDTSLCSPLLDNAALSVACVSPDTPQEQHD